MSSSVLVKICGTTSIHDAQLAAQAGAEYSGIIVEHVPSPRNVTLADAAEIAASVDIPVVAVTVNKSLEELLHIQGVLRPAVLQLHGDETPELVRELKQHNLVVWVVASGDAEAMRRRACVMTEAGADAILVDARTTSESGTIYGGTGHTGDWKVARELVDAGIRVVLAGGLSPDTVAAAIAQVRPWMVDVVSGVEASKGVKDPEKVRRFVAAAQMA